MMMESITLLPSLIVIGTCAGILFLTLVIFKFLSSGGNRRAWWPSSSSLPAPPGPRKWALPILGNLPYLMFMTRGLPLNQALYKMSKKYGRLMELQLGMAHCILVVCSPSAACLILQTHKKIFLSREPNIVSPSFTVHHPRTSLSRILDPNGGSCAAYALTSSWAPNVSWHSGNPSCMYRLHQT